MKAQTSFPPLLEIALDSHIPTAPTTKQSSKTIHNGLLTGISGSYGSAGDSPFESASGSFEQETPGITRPRACFNLT
jgi:hypothetical protein